MSLYLGMALALGILALAAWILVTTPARLFAKCSREAQERQHATAERKFAEAEASSKARHKNGEH